MSTMNEVDNRRDVAADPLERLIGDAARLVDWEYGTGEVDDIRQEMWAWALERERRIRGLSAERVFRALRNVGRNWCRKQRAERLIPIDGYTYTPMDVRMILGAVHEYYDVAVAPRIDDGQPADETDMWDIAMDIRRGLDCMDDSEVASLVGYFVHQTITDNALPRQRRDYLVTKLTHIINSGRSASSQRGAWYKRCSTAKRRFTPCPT